MTVELLKNLSMVSYILSVMFLIVSIILFFKFDVRKIIGDLSGANARKAIENIQKQNESGIEGVRRRNSPKKPRVQNVNANVNKENGFTTELDAVTPQGQNQTWGVVNETTVLETQTFFVLEVEMGFLGSNEKIG